MAKDEDDRALNRIVRVSNRDWEAFGRIAGMTQRAKLVRAFIAWYIRTPGAKLPDRPPKQRP